MLKEESVFLDSTNILNPGKTISESELVADLEHCLKKKKEVS